MREGHQSSLVKYLQVVLMALWTTATHGLDCFSCDASPGPDCISSPQVTCSEGQVCSNLVYRRRFNLGVLYTKGCEDEHTCFRLENLNTPSYCDHASSHCQHCCYGHLCNNAGEFHYLSVARYFWTYAILVYLSLTVIIAVRHQIA